MNTMEIGTILTVLFAYGMTAIGIILSGIICIEDDVHKYIHSLLKGGIFWPYYLIRESAKYIRHWTLFILFHEDTCEQTYTCDLYGAAFASKKNHDELCPHCRKSGMEMLKNLQV